VLGRKIFKLAKWNCCLIMQMKIMKHNCGAVAKLFKLKVEMFWLLIIPGDHLWDWVEQDRIAFVRFVATRFKFRKYFYIGRGREHKHFAFVWFGRAKGRASIGRLHQKWRVCTECHFGRIFINHLAFPWPLFMGRARRQAQATKHIHQIRRVIHHGQYIWHCQWWINTTHSYCQNAKGCGWDEMVWDIIFSTKSMLNENN